MTETTAQKDEKAKRKFRNWYENNREDYNAQRRERYKQNKELRDKARENARKQRAKDAVVDTSPVLRKVKGRTIKVYRTAAAGTMIGRSPETIRTWIKNGWVPDQDDEWSHRTFTKGQIKLMQRLANVIEKYRYAPDYQARVDKVVASIAKQW
jgi:hypothetical protein